MFIQQHPTLQCSNTKHQFCRIVNKYRNMIYLGEYLVFVCVCVVDWHWGAFVVDINSTTHLVQMTVSNKLTTSVFAILFINIYLNKSIMLFHFIYSIGK